MPSATTPDPRALAVQALTTARVALTEAKRAHDEAQRLATRLHEIRQSTASAVAEIEAVCRALGIGV